MKIKTISGGMLPTNCYLLTDEVTGMTAVIDPGFDSAELTNAIESVPSGKVAAILLTHGHFDHILGVDKVKSLTNAPVSIHTDDRLFPEIASLNLADLFSTLKLEPFSADFLLKDGDTIEVGNLKIKVIHTPGHTTGQKLLLLCGKCHFYRRYTDARQCRAHRFSYRKLFTACCFPAKAESFGGRLSPLSGSRGPIHFKL